MKRIFLSIIISFIIIFPSFIHGESLMIQGDPQSGVLSDSELSFDVYFDTSVITDNHIIDSVKLVYYQSDVGSGLIHMINRNSGDLIEVKNLNEKGFQFSLGYLDLFKEWLSYPDKNDGLLFKGVAFSPFEKIDLTTIYLSIDYHLPDLIPPYILSSEIRKNIDYTNYIIEIETNEIVTAEIEYGKTSMYTLKKYSDTPEYLHNFDLTGLDVGLSYHYRFKLTDNVGNVSYTKDAVFITGADLLGKEGYSVLGTSLLPPTNISVEIATVGNRNGLLVNFDRSSNGDLYIIYKDSGKGFEEIAQIVENSYFDPKVYLGNTYIYMIRTVFGPNISGESEHISYYYKGEVEGESLIGTQMGSNVFAAILTVALILVFGSYTLMHIGKRIFIFFFPKKEDKLKNSLRDPASYY